ncbi:MAG: hypothetical protein KBA11_08060 [Sedimentibacter sp.]|nr:hypothetical protein [Sedimentibacter sp.]
MSWDYGKHLNSEIHEIKTLQSKGYTTRNILDRNKFSCESLKACGLPISYLVPKLEGQKLTLQEWDTHTSIEHKWELVNGLPFGQEDERDRVMLGLIYTAGLKHLLELLPEESKRELIKLIKQSDM